MEGLARAHVHQDLRVCAFKRDIVANAVRVARWVNGGVVANGLRHGSRRLSRDGNYGRLAVRRRSRLLAAGWHRRFV